MFNLVARDATVMVGSFSMALATRRSLAESEGGLPPTRARARAALKAGIGSFTDDAAFKFGKCSKDVEDHFPAR
ncbi:hypothetical protein SAMN05216387_10352 [Nitrosovibrio tenuis]|uniref:Uncharacterized protein n=1 Tax=Nitrosovibrio tenuis TaxID=1233 RepID=A0A1H7JZ29_9PROT|nr:hypothetical protein SAMN05216387_10352 [Nitrosovibrio tenuis]